MRGDNFLHDRERMHDGRFPEGTSNLQKYTMNGWENLRLTPFSFGDGSEESIAMGVTPRPKSQERIFVDSIDFNTTDRLMHDP